MQAGTELIRAIAVTAELCGTTLSEDAGRVFAEDLGRYPLGQVMKSLARCRREVKGRLVLADVISRLDDGRPGVEEAWAMMPRGEGESVVWTNEMAAAYGVCCEHLELGNDIEARIAFKEKYSALVSAARDEGAPVNWSATLGHTSAGREEAAHEARNRNREVSGLPALPFTPRDALPAPTRRALSGPAGVMDAVVNVIAGSQQGRDILAGLKRKLKAK